MCRTSLSGLNFGMCCWIWLAGTFRRSEHRCHSALFKQKHYAHVSEHELSSFRDRLNSNPFITSVTKPLYNWTIAVSAVVVKHWVPDVHTETLLLPARFFFFDFKACSAPLLTDPPTPLPTVVFHNRWINGSCHSSSIIPPWHLARVLGPSVASGPLHGIAATVLRVNRERRSVSVVQLQHIVNLFPKCWETEWMLR